MKSVIFVLLMIFGWWLWVEHIEANRSSQATKEINIWLEGYHAGMNRAD